MSNKAAVIVLTGPTAVGKTALSLRLARELPGEIVSADSMQVYRGMDIGTAKATKEEQALVPHHMIDVAEAARDFSVADYVQMAAPLLEEIPRRGRVPLVTGGTGFYIQALLKGLDFSGPASDGIFRRELEERARQEGPWALHRELEALDPESAAAIHPHNIKRVIRALEYYRETGGPISQINQQQRAKESAYRVLYLVLNRPRQELYCRIEKRVESMFRAGLVEEVKTLLQAGAGADTTAMQALGYKEVLACLQGEISLEEAKEKIIVGSRHYAKRQLTWFRREKDALWIPVDAYPGEEELYRAVYQHCRRFLDQI